MQDWLNMITNVGFPIACCFFLFKQQGDLNKTLGELSNTLTGINVRLDNIEDSIKECKKKEEN